MPMDERHFWKFVEDSIYDAEVKDKAKQDDLVSSLRKRLDPERRGKAKLDDVVSCLMTHLEKLSAPEVREFGAEYEKRMQALYRWDLWAIAYIIHGGCSDDGFEDFRNWIIFQGKDFYLKSMEDPTYVAEITETGSRCKLEPYIYFQIGKLYEAKSGLCYETTLYDDVDGPIGKQWTNRNELWEMYPDVCDKFMLPD